MDTTRPKKFVFVLMPFAEDFDDVYQLGIKPACQESGAYCERVDEQIFSESILERVYNQINKADLIVADMTGRNPNVFYEVGYAHALGKRVILLTQRADDIPFDLKHYPHIVYEAKIIELKAQLTSRVERFLAIDDASALWAEAIRTLEFYIEGQKISDGAVVNVLLNGNSGPLPTEFSGEVSGLLLHNPSSADIPLRFGISLVFGPSRADIDGYSGTPMKLPDGSVMTDVIETGFMLGPGAWRQLRCRLHFMVESPLPVSVPSTIRFFMPTGTEEVSYITNLVERWP